MNAAVVIKKHWRGHIDSTTFVYHLIDIIITQVSIACSFIEINRHINVVTLQCRITDTIGPVLVQPRKSKRVGMAIHLPSFLGDISSLTFLDLSSQTKNGKDGEYTLLQLR